MAQGLSGVRALRSGALEICIKPAKWLTQLQDQVDRPGGRQCKNEQRAENSYAGLANRPKLSKMMVSQKISTTRNGIGIELFVCANSSRRICAMSVAICRAFSLQEALGIVLRRKLLKLRKECVACGARLEGVRLGNLGSFLAPHSIG